MSRVTKNIRLVLISSSLALSGCGSRAPMDPTCGGQLVDGKPVKMVEKPEAANAIPSVCGPVQNGTTSSGGHHGSHFWGWGWWGGGMGRSSSVTRSPAGSPIGGVSHLSGSSGASAGGGKSASVGSSRGGFGSSTHGVSS